MVGTDGIEDELAPGEVPIVIVIDEPSPASSDEPPTLPRRSVARPSPSAPVRRVHTGGRDPIETRLEREIEAELSVGRAVHKTIAAVPWIYRSVALLLVGLAATLLAVGWEYYVTPLVHRPFHHLHEVLRPSGPLALSLGVLGTATILASLAYVLRKRVVAWTRFGTLRAWMGFHVFTGLVGPAMVLFHAAFVPASALGLLAFLALVVVVASGIVGRFIYVAIPTSPEGQELDAQVVRRRLEVYSSELRKLEVDESLLCIDAHPTQRREWLWLVHALIGIVYGDRVSRRDFARLRDALHLQSCDAATRERALLLAGKLCRERQWLCRHRELQKLLGAWRFFHVWLAIVLLVAVAFHILIALRFGDLWILSGVGG